MRWNSTYDILERLLKVEEAISLLHIQLDVDSSIATFDGDMCRVAEDAVAGLNPCYQATLELSAQRFSKGFQRKLRPSRILGWGDGDGRGHCRLLLFLLHSAIPVVQGLRRLRPNNNASWLSNTASS